MRHLSHPIGSFSVAFLCCFFIAKDVNAFQNPPDCNSGLGEVITVDSLPFVMEAYSLCGHANDVTGNSWSGCGTSWNRMSGMDVVVKYTAPEDQCVEVGVQYGSSVVSFYYGFYEECPYDQVVCKFYSAGNETRYAVLEGGKTYYLLLDQNGSDPDCASIDVTINTVESCGIADLTASIKNDTTIRVTRINVFGGQCNTIVSTEYRAVLSGLSPEDTSAIVKMLPWPFPSETLIQGLTPGYTYDVYARHVCNAPLVGPWSNPVSITLPPRCFANLSELDTFEVRTLDTMLTTCGKGNFPYALHCTDTMPGQDDVFRLHAAAGNDFRIRVECDVPGTKVGLLYGCPLIDDPASQSVIWCSPLTDSSQNMVEYYVCVPTTQRFYYLQIDHALADTCGEYRLTIDTFAVGCGEVTNAQVTTTISSVTVEWDKPVIFNDFVKHYEVRLVPNNASVNQFLVKVYPDKNDSTRTFANLPLSENYDIYLRTICLYDSDTSAWIGPVDAFTGPCPIEIAYDDMPTMPMQPVAIGYGSTCGQENRVDAISVPTVCHSGPGPEFVTKNITPYAFTPLQYYVLFRVPVAGAKLSAQARCDMYNPCRGNTTSASHGQYGYYFYTEGDSHVYLIADHETPGVCYDYTYEIIKADTAVGNLTDWLVTGPIVPQSASDCRALFNTELTYDPVSEPLPPCMDDSTRIGWLGITAPASGSATLRISAPDSMWLQEFNAAFYKHHPDPAEPEPYTYISCAVEDTAFCDNCKVITYGGMVPGENYYLGVGGERSQTGKLCFGWSEDVLVGTDTMLFVTTIDSVSGNAWINISDPEGYVVAAINPNNNDLGTVSIQKKVLPEVPQLSNNARLIPRMFEWSCDGPDCIDGTLPFPATLRLFFSENDLQRLNQASGANNPLSQLLVYHYEGANEDVDPLNNDTLPKALPAAAVKKFGLGARSFSVEVKTSGFSEFFLGTPGMTSGAPSYGGSPEFDLTLTPMPVTDWVRASFYLATNQHLQVRITDLEGRNLREENFELAAGDQTFELDLSMLPEGVYLMHVLGEEGRTVRRVVKL